MEFLQSLNHPDLANSKPPQTLQASQSLIASGRKLGKSARKCKRARLSIYDVSQLVVAKGIKTRVELLTLACQQEKEGKEDLVEFTANRGSKVVDKAIHVGWEIEEAKSKLSRQQMWGLEILCEDLQGPCVENCKGQWLELALDILSHNNIPGGVFQSAVHDLLDKGRGKYRNILVKGSANCGKTFLLNPLNVIFNTFSNPASSNFAWVGARSAEIIFLNDFRWNPQVFPWHDMLLLSKGQTVHLPTPRTILLKTSYLVQIPHTGISGISLP